MPRRPLASLILVLLPLLLAAGAGPASARRAVIETRDLRLVYPSRAMDFIAPYAARCFENSMRFHRELWGYDPSEKCTVVMDDMGDYLNAGVSTAPVNNMSFSIAPANFVYETTPSNERMSFTMNHEKRPSCRIS